MRIRARTNARSRISSVRRPEIASDACRHGSGCCARQFCESESSSLSEKRIHRAHNSALRWGAEPSSPREGDGSLPIRLPDRLAIPFLEPQPQPQQEGEEGEAAQEGQEGPKAPIRLSDRLAIPVLEPQSQPQQEGEEGQAGQEGQERPKASEASQASQAEAKVPLLVQEQEQEQEQGEERRSRTISATIARGQAREVQDPIPPRARRIARGTTPTRASSPRRRSFVRPGGRRSSATGRRRMGEGEEPIEGPNQSPTRRRRVHSRRVRSRSPEALPRTRPREGREQGPRRRRSRRTRRPTTAARALRPRPPRRSSSSSPRGSSQIPAEGEGGAEARRTDGLVLRPRRGHPATGVRPVHDAPPAGTGEHTGRRAGGHRRRGGSAAGGVR